MVNSDIYVIWTRKCKVNNKWILNNDLSKIVCSFKYQSTQEAKIIFILINLESFYIFIKNMSIILLLNEKEGLIHYHHAQCTYHFDSRVS